MITLDEFYDIKQLIFVFAQNYYLIDSFMAMSRNIFSQGKDITDLIRESHR